MNIDFFLWDFVPLHLQILYNQPSKMKEKYFHKGQVQYLMLN